MADYYDVIWRSVAAHGSDPDRRHIVYERARSALRDRLRAVDPSLSDAVMSAEQDALEIAIHCVEADVERINSVGKAPDKTLRLRTRSRVLPIAFGAAAFCAALFLGVAGVYRWSKPSLERSQPRQTLRTTGVEFDDRAVIPNSSLVQVNLPYIFLRQLVYYRTTYPPGTIVIDKVQRYLYLTRPNAAAVRYGIGVGKDCLDMGGIFQVSRKEERPAWQLAPLQWVKFYEQWRAVGETDNPLGARAVYLDSNVHLIHGTKLKQSIGRSVWLGCVRLADDDLIEFYSRISVGNRVVMAN